MYLYGSSVNYTTYPISKKSLYILSDVSDLHTFVHAVNVAKIMSAPKVIACGS